MCKYGSISHTLTFQENSFCGTSAMSARGLPSLGYSFGALHQVYLSHSVMLKILNIRYRWQSF